jgi:hypothetical protein
MCHVTTPEHDPTRHIYDSNVNLRMRSQLHNNVTRKLEKKQKVRICKIGKLEQRSSEALKDSSTDIGA